MLDERGLQGIELIAMREAFHGLDRFAVHPHGELAAGTVRLAIHEHRASTAFASVAADLVAGEMR
jgi:hypothetical protein